MRITFYADEPYWSQLSNNGGTSTILRSVMTLRELGHEANVVARKDNFTYFKHPKPVRHIPKDSDVCIAVTVRDIAPMLTRMPKKAKPFWWCRLIESYSMPKEKIATRPKKIPTLVNSEGLQAWFRKYGRETTVAYQGVDVEGWRDEGLRNGRKMIGFLVSNKPRKHFDVVENIIKKLGSEYDYIGYGGAKDQSGHTKDFAARNFLYFKTDVQHADLLRLYNLCHTWVATSTKEGLHNPPIEAALCGCAVVYPDAPRSGCSDHCIDGQTAWEYEAGNYESACEAIRMADKSRNQAHVELIKTKIGDRKQAMQRLVDIISTIGGIE